MARIYGFLCEFPSKKKTQMKREFLLDFNVITQVEKMKEMEKAFIKCDQNPRIKW